MNRKQELIDELAIEYRNSLFQKVQEAIDDKEDWFNIKVNTLVDDANKKYLFNVNTKSSYLIGQIYLSIPYNTALRPFVRWESERLHVKTSTPELLYRFFELIYDINTLIYNINADKVKL